jgi:soluble lytic murein transglycosylase-like protein
MRAAEEPNTFYGLIARRALGERITQVAYSPPRSRQLLGEADLAAVSETPDGTVAFALLQVGQKQRAISVLRRLGARLHDNPGIVRAATLIAENAGARQVGGWSDEFALYARTSSAGVGVPSPDLQPAHGFQVDPALIYGLARVESNFNSDAVSSRGARGLMQLMPQTANSMAGTLPEQSANLDDPETNLELGQRYVMYLARHSAIDYDLIRLLASYNAGPNKCASWDIRPHADPLLFIEAIPVEETRVFVQRALAFTWMYAARLNLPASSLDELAGGDFPRFRQVAVSTDVAVRPRLSRLN